jgi:ketosteroid isomerase-like protein
LSHATGAPHPEFNGHSEIQEIQVNGDWAYLWTRLHVDVTQPGGKLIKRAGHTLSVLRKTGGRWLLARDANLLTTVES